MALQRLDLRMSRSAAQSTRRRGCGGGLRGEPCGGWVELPEEVARKVHDHPCYSADAHHYYARMHLPVAPRCNLQCHYCNRKFDCANESRPGVTSELLSPQEAVRKVQRVAALIPQLSVVGIAGPGDPLANVERTFATLRGVREAAPDLKLCLSTNGLVLPQYVDALVALGVDHVTITINGLDPEIGARIYSWVLWEGRRLDGVVGAARLIAQQQRGLAMLVARGVLVKVNSVMIPGVNDHHLEEVSRRVRKAGAFIHNIMPLVVAPEHGTHYGHVGQRGPTHAEVRALQDRCGADMAMMRHCRRCRADAVGMLGEDRSAELSLAALQEVEVDYPAVMLRRARHHRAIEVQRAARRAAVAGEEGAEPPPSPITVAVATAGGGLVNQHFGRATELLVYEASARGVYLVGPRTTGRYCHGGLSWDAGSGDALAPTLAALDGCDALLCAQIGDLPRHGLEAAGIHVETGHAMAPIETAVAALWRGMAAVPTP